MVVSTATPPSSFVTEIEGDLLTCNSKYIVHQCNCLTTNAAGLAKWLFEKYPYANVYTRGSIRIPGTIQIRGNPDLNQQLVVNLFGQNSPGKPYNLESESVRSTWFKEGLQELAKMGESLHSVAFPYLIGCGLAGGNWLVYKKRIEDFAQQVSIYGVQVIIVKLPSL